MVRHPIGRWLRQESCTRENLPEKREMQMKKGALSWSPDANTLRHGAISAADPPLPNPKDNPRALGALSAAVRCRAGSPCAVRYSARLLTHLPSAVPGGAD